MAQRTTVVITDDLDGKAAESTHRFNFRGQWYEIDLSKQNAKQFSQAMDRFVKAARKVRPSSNGVVRRPVVDRQRNAQIREWATGQGIQVPNRGRISSAVIAKYDAAH